LCSESPTFAAETRRAARDFEEGTVDSTLFNTKRNWRAAASLGFIAFVWAASAPAQQTEPPATDTTGGDVTSMDLESLMNVDVTTASRFPDKLSEAPSIMSVVTSDELRRFGGMTLGEILQHVTGVTGTSQYFTDRSMVAIRGEQTDTAGGHILILINGRPTREVMEGGIMSDLLQSFPVEILERIEIIRGPGSVLYGSDAFAGVINLITKKAMGNKIAIKGMGGPGDAEDASTQLFYDRGRLSAVGAAQLNVAPDWPVTYTVPLSLRNSPAAPHVPNVQNVTVVDRGVGSYLGVNYRDLSIMSSFTEWQSTAFVMGNVGETHLTRDFLNVGYDHKQTSNWDMDFNLTYTRTTFSEVPYASTTRDSYELLGEWTNLITLGPRDRLTVGALFDRIAGTEIYTGSIPHQIAATGNRPGGSFYVQLDHQLVRQLKLVGGFQTNKIGTIPLDVVPRAGAVWSPTPWVSVKALYGQAFSAPSLDELLLNRPGIVGNPNLLPEKIATTEVGVSFQRGRAEASADYFHSKQTNSIVSVSGHPIHYVNLGELTFNGAEVEVKYYFQKDFFAQGSMLYQTNVNGYGQTNVTPIPDLGFKAGLSYEDSRGLSVSLFLTSDEGITGYSGALNPLQGSHNVLNGDLRYDLRRVFHISERNRISFVAHANNITDHPVWLPSWGFTSVDTIPVEQGAVVYAGLQFSAGNR
jgi:outer membrane receptor protein involved in Fe transport